MIARSMDDVDEWYENHSPSFFSKAWHSHLPQMASAQYDKTISLCQPQESASLRSTLVCSARKRHGRIVTRDLTNVGTLCAGRQSLINRVQRGSRRRVSMVWYSFDLEDVRQEYDFWLRIGTYHVAI